MNRTLTLETIVEDLKALPSAKLEEAAVYIRHLREKTRLERRIAIERSAAVLTDEEGSELERIITEGCEK